MMDGQAAEAYAAEFLRRQGLRLLEKNYRCRMGEIDLIMDDAGVLVFVEVRLRRSENFGGAAASITPHKQRKLIHAAQHYLQQQARQPACRFDAILLDGARVEWVRDAFGA
jgi:putative endonuclease